MADQKTLREQLGLAGADLKTPRHDAIVIWLDGNIEQLIEDGIVSTHSTGWDKAAIEGMRRRALGAYAEKVKSIKQENESIYKRKTVPPLPEWSGLGMPPAEPFPKIDRKVWEYQVATDRGYPVGYIDLLVSYRGPTLFVDNVEHNYGDRYTLVHHNLPEWAVMYDDERLIAFEVKPAISSVGEVIRQVRRYQQLCEAEYYVVSPDDSFAKYFRDQGIGFIQCPA